MTREQKWLRKELSLLEPLPPTAPAHFRRRRETLERILAIVEEAQASDRFLGGALCALACIAAHEDPTSTLYKETARSFLLEDLIREARRIRDPQLKNLLILQRSIERYGR